MRRFGQQPTTPQRRRFQSNQPPVVLFVSATGWLAGPTRSLATVIRYRGEPRTCVLASPTGELPDLVIREGAVGQFVPLRRHKKWERLSRISATVTASTWIVRHRRAVGAIHANGLSELNTIGLGALIARVPVVVWNHSSVPSPIAGRMARVWRTVLPFVQWVAVSPIARTAVHSATGLPEQDVIVIPNPIDLNDVHKAVPSHRISPISVGYLSEASERKGFGVLLEAARLMDDSDVEWRLFTELVPGTAAWDGARSVGQVRNFGRLEDVAMAYAQCDIVFCPSFSESFGRVAAEAMANGIPVVASDIPAFRDLVGHGEAGLLFPPGNARAAAIAVKELANGQVLRQRLGEEGRRRTAMLSPSNVVPLLERLYRSY